MVEFELKVYFPMRRDLRDLALATVAMVWDTHVGRDVRFNVVTIHNVANLDGAMIDPNGAYVPGARLIAFALKKLLESSLECDWAVQVVRVAAHEAMHAVQFAEGDAAERMASLPPQGSAERRESPLEVEANQESVDVLKGYNPNLTGAMPYGDREYPVPAASRYTEHWKQVRAGHRRYVIVSETGPGGTKPPNSEA